MHITRATGKIIMIDRRCKYGTVILFAEIFLGAANVLTKSFIIICILIVCQLIISNANSVIYYGVHCAHICLICVRTIFTFFWKTRNSPSL